MTRKDKLLQKFIQNPTSLSYQKIEVLLLDMGLKKRQGKGSHITFTKERTRITFPVHNNKTGDVYKKQAFKTLKKNNFLPL